MAWTLAAGVAATAAAGSPADEKGTPTVETIEYRGWKHNLRLRNGDAELIVTLDVGPRILSYRLAGGKNVFKEYDAQLGGTGESEWMIRGGHRLWAAPEDTTRTYYPDNAPVAHREAASGVVRFTPPPEREYGLQKEIDVRLEPSGSRVTVTHRIANVGRAPTRLAPWALSVMAPGGTEIIPLPPHRPHPGSPKNARSAADFAPSLLLVAWPFTDFQDPRWRFGSRFITLRQDATRGATKLGLAHTQGAIGYLNAGTLFVKRFGYDAGKTYPDHGVNWETFTNEDMLEMESLGPLADLPPGQAVEHVEHWELFGGVGDATTEAALEATIAPRLR
jgi:hypothetical protein